MHGKSWPFLAVDPFLALIRFDEDDFGFRRSRSPAVSNRGRGLSSTRKHTIGSLPLFIRIDIKTIVIYTMHFDGRLRARRDGRQISKRMAAIPRARVPAGAPFGASGLRVSNCGLAITLAAID